MRKYIRMGLRKGYRILTSSIRFSEYAKNPKKYPLEERYRYTHDFMNDMNKAFHVKLIIKGEENIIDGPCFYTPNHDSVMDPIVLLMAIKRPITFVAKKQAAGMPFVSKILKAIDGKFIDRNDLRSELKVFRELDQELEQEKDLSVVIFPEGTRSKVSDDFRLLPFHPGSFKVPTRRNLPIVPVCLYLTDRILNQKYHYKRYPVQLTFLKPLYPEDYKDLSTAQISDIVYQRIDEELQRMKKLDFGYIREFNGYSDKKTKKVQIIR